MKKLIYLLVGILVLVLVSCGGPAPSSSSSSAPPSPTTQPPPQTSSSPTQKPSPTASPPATGTGQEVEFPPYPGANQVSKVVTSDTGPSGQKGAVTVYFLTTNDPYEKVKSYYQEIIPADWETAGTSETQQGGQKTFVLSAQSTSEDAWVTFIVATSEENMVTISHTLGKEGEAPASSVPETGKLTPYPQAEVTDTSQWTGPGPNGQQANWFMTNLTTKDPYEKVKVYYQLNTPPEFVKVMDHEETNADGERSYILMLQSPTQIQFYVISIEENLEEQSVEISYNYGTK